MFMGKVFQSIINERYCENKRMLSENNEFIFGLDDIFEKITKYCRKLLENDDDFKIAKKSLQLHQPFFFMVCLV